VPYEVAKGTPWERRPLAQMGSRGREGRGSSEELGNNEMGPETYCGKVKVKINRA